jgi:hypothetical protein
MPPLMDMPSLPPPIPPPLPTPRASHGWKWLIGAAVLLLAVVFFFVGLAATRVVQTAQLKRQQNQEALRDFNRAADDARKELREGFDENKGYSPEKGIATARKLEDQLAKAQEKLSGEDARIAAATRNWLAGFREKAAVYTDLLQEIKIEKLLDLNDLDRETLATRRKNVERMLAANQQVTETTRNMERDFDAELVKQKVSQKTRDEVLRGYRETGRKRSVLLLKIRATDDTIAKSTLEIYDILDGEWGKWKFDAARSTVVFQSGKARSDYQEAIERVQTASKEQTELQRELTK